LSPGIFHRSGQGEIVRSAGGKVSRGGGGCQRGWASGGVPLGPRRG
jgi:hypothetical protein